MSETAPRQGRGFQFSYVEERRRSQRVVIRIPVILRYLPDEQPGQGNECREGSGAQETFEASTVSVNNHGAMLLSPRTPAADTVLEMENIRTREKLKCRVTRTPVVCPEGYLTPVEFLTPAADFWRISFPPTNWKPGEE